MGVAERGRCSTCFCGAAKKALPDEAPVVASISMAKNHLRGLSTRDKDDRPKKSAWDEPAWFGAPIRIERTTCGLGKLLDHKPQPIQTHLDQVYPTVRHELIFGSNRPGGVEDGGLEY